MGNTTNQEMPSIIHLAQPSLNVEPSLNVDVDLTDGSDDLKNNECIINEINNNEDINNEGNNSKVNNNEDDNSNDNNHKNNANNSLEQILMELKHTRKVYEENLKHVATIALLRQQLQQQQDSNKHVQDNDAFDIYQKNEQQKKQKKIMNKQEYKNKMTSLAARRKGTNESFTTNEGNIFFFKLSLY